MWTFNIQYLSCYVFHSILDIIQKKILNDFLYGGKWEKNNNNHILPKKVCIAVLFLLEGKPSFPFIRAWLIDLGLGRVFPDIR